MKRRTLLALSASGLAAAAVTGIVVSRPSRAQWVKVSEYPKSGLSPRDCGVHFAFEDSAWISDGWLRGGASTGDLLSSKDGRTWETVLSSLPYGEFTPIGVHDGAIWAAGNGVWRSVDGIEFSRIKTDRAPPLAAHAPLISSNGYMVIIDEVSGTIHSSRDGTLWRSVSAPFGRRKGAVSCIVRERTFVVGGAMFQPNIPAEEGYPELTSTSDIWWSDTPHDETSWHHELAPWRARMWPALAEWNGNLCVSGGYDNHWSNREELNHPDLWMMSRFTGWQEIQISEPPIGRHAATLYVVEGKLMKACGNTNIGASVVSEIFQLSWL